MAVDACPVSTKYSGSSWLRFYGIPPATLPCALSWNLDCPINVRHLWPPVDPNPPCTATFSSFTARVLLGLIVLNLSSEGTDNPNCVAISIPQPVRQTWLLSRRPPHLGIPLPHLRVTPRRHSSYSPSILYPPRRSTTLTSAPNAPNTALGPFAWSKSRLSPT
ncbi:hypothetical protein JAAARDRAFT_328800 [Jaapia argillacea MUCL 33604]|uniref:Uncharacterized protein n=1 Tax=Jaapia argillacea MUCL 33604 TaxID=933084 RepID=A0A067PWT7_9AGAM|nr:hypothetical protein JAAARDRAFT_328800 [Jaapia argillacea MUCL 33604]